MKWRRKLREVWDNSILCIEWVLAICSIITASYIFTPLYAIGKAIRPSVLAMVLTHPLMISAWAAVVLIGGVLVILGLLLNRSSFRSSGWFLVFLARLYQVLATLIVAGVVPLQWFPSFTIGLIVLILWARARRET